MRGNDQEFLKKKNQNVQEVKTKQKKMFSILVMNK